LNKFTSEDYVQYLQQLHVCGILRKTESETKVLALAVYRNHFSTFDTIRFEIDDLIVDVNKMIENFEINFIYLKKPTTVETDKE
jgi:hypothetical protein